LNHIILVCLAFDSQKTNRFLTLHSIYELISLIHHIVIGLRAYRVVRINKILKKKFLDKYSLVHNGVFTAPYMPQFTSKQGIWRRGGTFV